MAVKEEKSRLFSMLQNEMHQIQSYFFNGKGLTYLNKLLYPQVIYLSPQLVTTIEHLYSILIQFREPLAPSFKIFFDYTRFIKSKKRYDCQSIAKLISFYYVYFEEVLPLIKIKKKRIIKLNKILVQDAFLKTDYTYLNPLFKLQKFIQNYLSNDVLEYAVHGSFSTKDYIKGHSDMDTIVILKKEAMQNPQKILRVRKLLCQATRYFFFIDPMQHHGHYIISEQDMHYYPQTIFPLILFNYSTSLINQENKLVFNERDSKKEKKGLLLNYLATFKKYSDPVNYPTNIYALKFLLQTVLLFPVVYFQYKGQSFYKREAITKIKKQLPKSAFKLVENIERIRKDNMFNVKETALLLQNIFSYVPNPLVWPALFRFNHNKIPPKVTSLIRPNLSNQLTELAKFLEKELKKKK